MQSVRDSSDYMPGQAARAEIEAYVAAYNRERPEIYARCRRMAISAVAIYVIFGLAAFYWGVRAGEAAKVALLVFFGFLAGGYLFSDLPWKPIKMHQVKLRYRLFPKVFGFIDKIEYDYGLEPCFLRDLKALKLIPFAWSQNNHLIRGCHEGMDFELAETRLLLPGSRSETTAFRGLIFRLQLATPFPGVLLVTGRGNWLQRGARELTAMGSDLIPSGNSKLDEIYEFRSDNRAVARAVLAGPLTLAMVRLDNEWHGGAVRIALRQGDCFLLLPSEKDYFALPPIQNDVHYQHDIAPVIRDMVVLLAVAHLIGKMG